MGIKTVSLKSEYRSEMIADIMRSLRDTGFLVLTDHGIDQADLTKLYEMWSAFFTHPTFKKKFTFNKDRQWGYFPIKSEKAKDAKVADIKEFYHFFMNNPESILPALPVELEHVTRKIALQLEDIAVVLLQLIEKHTPSSVNTCDRNWSKSVDGSDQTLLRILHYPPLGPDAEEGAVRAAAHEDINFITLLPAATQPGLEVKDNHGNWVSVDVLDPNSIIVNVGDMLQECTGGYFKSTTHRVVNPEGQNNVARLSLPLFLHPTGDTRLSARHTAHSYLMERLKELGLI